MAHCSTLMGQLLQLIPRHVFHHLVDTHAWQGPDVRKFSYWSHLTAMLFGQWSARKSLRRRGVQRQSARPQALPSGPFRGEAFYPLRRQ
ncbi:MAG: DUF4372 domain-containing protein [Desulfomonile tiedjei]|nr:DUF4372 domain-containing protein [Desulfomonile tiedjei]